MNVKSLKSPALILAIGLLLATIVCLLTNMILIPSVTEYEFPYSITYTLNGETKTVSGVYKCAYDGFNEGYNPRDRYYKGEFIVDGQSTLYGTYTIAEKDGAELYIVVTFNDEYLMNDTKSENYNTYVQEPYLESIDRDGYEILPEESPAEFAAEIVSWDYPEPIDNKFTFGGFSLMHVGSMRAMLAIGLLTLVACMILVKKDPSVCYNALDKISTVLNFAVCFFVIPFITIVIAFLQLTMSTDGVVYQIYLCIPAFTAFTVAASVALRRKGFTKSGMLVQLVGPVLFIVPIVMESWIDNLFM